MSAAEWLATAEEQEIREVIRDYGEERFAKQIAAAIVAARRGAAIVRTRQLADLVAQAVRTREPGQDPATRTFQALRIHVNRELEEVSLMLPQAVARLAPQGRLAVISFHSLEDRIVKRFMQQAARPEVPRGCRCVPAKCHNRCSKSWDVHSARPPEETRRNPRARSATLRVAERTAVPYSRDRARRAVAKLNLLLLAVLVACALGLVTSQHKGAAPVLAARARAGARARARGRVRPPAARGQHLGPALAGREARYALARPAPGRSAARALRRARRRAVSRAAQGLVRLPVWRARFVLIALRRGLRGARRPLGLPAGDAHRLPAGEGRGALLARARDPGDARPHPRPQRRGARGLDAGEVGLGDPRRRRRLRQRAAQARRAAGDAAQRARKAPRRRSRDFVYLKRQIAARNRRARCKHSA